jgi:Na+/proline symporter
MNFLMGVLVIIYTVAGGTRAVNVTHKQQMFVIFAGLIAAFVVIISLLPDDITFEKAISIADSNGKMNAINFSFDAGERYNIWTGIFGGLFLALAYFGTDQSQVQRYISGKSIRQSQMGLMFNAVLKIPMQFFILLTGVMVYVFFQFTPAPLNFNPQANTAAMNSIYQDKYAGLHQEIMDNTVLKVDILKDDLSGWDKAQLRHFNNVEKKNRAEARDLIKDADPSQESNDKDYIFIYFILNYLPQGLIGLLLAVIFCAAMSSTSAELSALASITAIDLYKRHTNKSDMQVLKMSRWFIVMWGGIAILLACFGTLFENLIQFVNIVGSMFYGNVLGIFLLAFFCRFINGNVVFWSAVITQAVVFAVFYFCVFREDLISYLLMNVVGCGLVMLLALGTHLVRKIMKPESIV